MDDYTSPTLAEVHWFWKETMNALETHRQNVLEGHGYDAANAFCKYMLFSGIDKLLRAHNNSTALKVDSGLIYSKARDLRELVCERYREGDTPKAQQSTLAGINHKLDLIAGLLARTVLPRVQGDSPQLSVVGGQDAKAG